MEGDKVVSNKFYTLKTSSAALWDRYTKECSKSRQPFHELKAAKANGGDGWDVLNRKKAFIRHVAAVICRENSRMICSATRMRPAGSRVVARGRSPGERA
eukprot:scaffold5810_cov112-Isochrysis_galbana.AAC.2